MKPREVCRRIERLGGYYVTTKGSHREYAVLYGQDGRVRTWVPMHSGDVLPGTLRKIERDLEPALGKGWLRR